MLLKIKPAKVAIVDNRARRLTAAQVKEAMGCDIVFNGGLFDMATLQPNCDVKADGVLLNDDQWTYYGYGWKNGELPRVAHSNELPGLDNFISCLWGIHEGRKQTLDDKAAGVGGTRGRTAFGYTADRQMVILCVADGAQALTLNGARDKLFDAGCISGIILDGGGSSQIIAPEGKINSTRIVSNLICVWIDNPAGQPVGKKEPKKMKICLDPGHGLAEAANKSPDGSYYEHEFALDMANRIRTHLVRNGHAVLLTREDSSTPPLSARAAQANAWGANLFCSLHSNAVAINEKSDPDGDGWGDVEGLTAWIMAAGGERERAAKLLLEEMKAAGVKTFGAELYTANFAVLARTSMPAMLIEYAFHTTKADVTRLKSAAHRAKLAEATARAIVRWGGTDWVSEPVSKVPDALPDSYYTVQFGAFVEEDNAKAMKALLEKAGYNTIIKGVKN